MLASKIKVAPEETKQTNRPQRSKTSNGHSVLFKILVGISGFIFVACFGDTAGAYLELTLVCVSSTAKAMQYIGGIFLQGLVMVVRLCMMWCACFGFPFVEHFSIKRRLIFALRVVVFPIAWVK